jgi:hypothetical protein
MRNKGFISYQLLVAEEVCVVPQQIFHPLEYWALYPLLQQLLPTFPPGVIMEIQGQLLGVKLTPTVQGQVANKDHTATLQEMHSSWLHYLE